VLAGADLEYVHQTKYLGVLLKASTQFKCSFDQAKIKFYRSFNAMCYRTKIASSELVCVQLLKSICMPVLLYAVEVLPPTKTDVARLDHALDRAVFRIFGSSSSADITYIREAVDISGVTGYVACRYRNFRRRYFTCFFMVLYGAELC